jgi:hypothetical protein
MPPYFTRSVAAQLRRDNNNNNNNNMVQNPSPASEPNNNNNDRAKEEEENTVEENYWPNILAYLETHDASRLLVTCSICQVNRLIIPGLPENDTGSDGKEHALILRCGHVLGHVCHARWVDAADSQEREPTCPVCRKPIWDNDDDDDDDDDEGESQVRF